VTLGGQTYPVPRPFLVLATQNPIESEGTYPLPEAQVDRFLLKVLVDYPGLGDETSVVARVVDGEPEVKQVMDVEQLEDARAVVGEVYADRRVMAYAVQLADATRHPGRYGLPHLDGAIEVGASPRGPIGMVQAAQALSLLRGRTHVTVRDIRDLAPDVLRHRLVLTYDAHADGIEPDDVVSQVLGAVEPPGTSPEAG
jgi:MoxR-like ATPase